MAFHPTQPLLATGSYDEAVKIYNTEDLTLVTTLSDHTSCVFSVAFHPTQSLLASGSFDDTVNIYNTEDFTLLTTLSDHTSYVRSVAFHPTQPLLATGSNDHTVKIYNTEDFTLLTTLSDHTDFVLSVVSIRVVIVLGERSQLQDILFMWDCVPYAIEGFEDVLQQPKGVKI